MSYFGAFCAFLGVSETLAAAMGSAFLTAAAAALAYSASCFLRCSVSRLANATAATSDPSFASAAKAVYGAAEAAADMCRLFHGARLPKGRERKAEWPGMFTAVPRGAAKKKKSVRELVYSHAVGACLSHGV